MAKPGDAASNEDALYRRVFNLLSNGENVGNLHQMMPDVYKSELFMAVSHFYANKEHASGNKGRPLVPPTVETAPLAAKDNNKLEQLLCAYRELLDLHDIGYHELDKSGKITHISDFALRQLGFRRGQVIGRNLWELILDKEQEVTKQETLRKLNSQAVPTKAVPKTFVCSDLAPFPSLVTDILLRDSKNQVSGMVSSVRGISAKNELASTLMEDTLFLSIADTLPICVLKKDEDGKITYANQRVCDELNCPVEDILNQTDDNVFPDQAEQYRRDDLQVMATGRALENIELHVSSGENETPSIAYPVQVLKMPIIVDGVAEGVQVLYWRLEDREKIMIDVIRAKENLLQSVLNNVRVWIFRKDKDRRFTYVSDRWANHVGREPSEVIGKTDEEIFQPDEAEKYKKDDLAVLRGKPFEGEEKHTTEVEGEMRVYVKKNPLFDKDGNVVGLQGVFWKVVDGATVGRNLDVAIRETHHRVRGNLDTVMKILEAQLSRNPDDRTRQVLEDCIGRIEAMSVVHSLFFKNKELAEIDLRRCIEPLIDALFRINKVPEGKIEAEVAVDTVKVDIDTAICCTRVITELVVNSIRHAFREHEKGRVSVSLSQESGIIKLVVSDNGDGIPRDKMPKVGEIRWGGLVIANGLVRESLKGECQHMPGEGTKFHITFPYHQGD